MDKKSFDLFELARMVVANRTLVIVIVLVVALAAVAYSLLTPQIWSSHASFFAVGDNAGGLPFDIPGLSGISSSLLGSGESNLAVNFATVLDSRTFGEEVIRKFDLITYFKLTNTDSLRNMDDALRGLSDDVLRLSVEDKSGLITISARTKSKQLSMDIVNHYLSRLDEYNRIQKVTKGKLNREFLEQRVKETRSILDSLIAVNRRFQESNKTIDLEAQAKAMIDSYGSIIAEKMKLDIELELARSVYGTGNPFIKELELKKSSLESQITSLERSGKTPKPQYLLDIDNIPAISSQYAQIKMNMEIYTRVYEFLYPQYEAARLTEMRDMPTIDILDTPRLAGRRDSPRRAIICVVATLLGFIFAIAVVLVKEYWKSIHDRLKV